MSRTILFLLAPLAIACGGAPPMTIAVVDHQYALSQCTHGQAAQAQLRERFEERHHALEQRAQELGHMRDELERQRASGADVAQAQARYADEHVRLQADEQAFHAEVAQADQSIGSGIAERVAAVVNDLAREHGVDLVLDKTLIAVASGRILDLTEEVVRVYDQRFPDPPAPAGPPATSAGGETPAAPQAPTPAPH